MPRESATPYIIVVNGKEVVTHHETITTTPVVQKVNESIKPPVVKTERVIVEKGCERFVLPELPSRPRLRRLPAEESDIYSMYDVLIEYTDALMVYERDRDARIVAAIKEHIDTCK